MKSLKSLVKDKRSNINDFVWIAGSQGICIMFTIIYSKNITHLINPYNYGLCALYITLQTVVNQLVFGPLAAGVLRYSGSNKDKRSDKEQFLCAWLMLDIVLAGCSSLLILTTINRKVSADVVIGTISYTILSGVLNFACNYLNGVQRRREYSIAYGIDGTLKYAISIALLILTNGKFESILYGYATSSAIALLYIVNVLRLPKLLKAILNAKSRIRKLLQSGWVNRTTQEDEVFKYVNAFALWGIFTALQSSSDRWSIMYFAGPKDLGIYAFSYQIGYTPIILLANVFFTFVAPHIYKNTNFQNRILKYYQLNKHECMIRTLISIVFWIAGLLLIANIATCINDYFANPSYKGTALMVFVLASSAWVTSTADFLNLFKLADNCVSDVKFVKIYTAIMGVILNLVLGSQWGAVGVAYAMMVTSVTYLSLCLLSIKRSIVI